MSTDDGPLPKDLTPQETAMLLKRILDGVERGQRKRWVEIACTILLSVATVNSAWCAYQSTRWGGVQTFRLAVANRAGRDSAAASLAALQSRAFDASMFISYMQAKYEGNDRQEKFLYSRFRPEMKRAVEAWLKSDPFNDPKAPLSPFKMAEYLQPELNESKELDEQFARELAAAHEANRNSDTYVLLTVLFATVLFFGGIAGTLNSERLHFITMTIALVFFVFTLAFLGSMPICRP